jgi:hypothetical protein
MQHAQKDEQKLGNESIYIPREFKLKAEPVLPPWGVGDDEHNLPEVSVVCF